MCLLLALCCHVIPGFEEGAQGVTISQGRFTWLGDINLRVVCVCVCVLCITCSMEQASFIHEFEVVIIVHSDHDCHDSISRASCLPNIKSQNTLYKEVVSSNRKHG